MAPVRRIVIECGAAQTRAALLIEDTPIRFWFGPARGDENLPRGARRGDVYLGRVRTATKALRGAFIDIGEARDGFLPVKPDAAMPVEGGVVIVGVKRPALAAKGAALAADWRSRLDEDVIAVIEARAGGARAPSRLSVDVDAALGGLDAFGRTKMARISVDEADAASALRAALAIRQVRCVVEHGVAADDRALIDEAIESALSREVSLPGGGRLLVDETEAICAVDVDAGTAAADASGRLGARVNAAAAARLFVELARRGIGGRVVVDFLPPGDGKARAALLAALKAGRGDFYECRFGRLSADGLFDLTAPREGASLLEIATAPDTAEPRCGRRFTLDWMAKAAICALERRLAAAPSARLRLVAGASLTDYFVRERPQWEARLAARYGARFTIDRDAQRKEREFDVVER